MARNKRVKSVSDHIRAHDDDELHVCFQKVMESHEIPSMAALALEYIAASSEFDKGTGGTACLEHAMELLRAIAQITTADAGMAATSTRAVHVREIEVMDPYTENTVGVSIYRLAGGGMVGIDSSYLEQDMGPVFSLFDRGIVLDLDDGEVINYQTWIVDQLEHHTNAFTLWLEHHQVATYTDDVKRKDDVERRGFPLPDREADAVWTLPESEDYPTGSASLCWWQEGDSLLGFSESTDPVMCLEYMRWYRVPIAAIRQYIRSSERKRATA
jgi:hypothetical protein